MSINDFRKYSNGVVINTNKSNLYAARKRKQIIREKDKRINDLEKRLEMIESFITKQNKG